MNIYYDNRVEAATLTSPQANALTPLANLHHYFLSLTTDFTSLTVTINGEWPGGYPEYVSALILGLTNARQYQIALYDVNNTKAYDSGLMMVGENKLCIKDFPGMIARRFVLTLAGTVNVTLGLLYLGDKLVMPPFTTGATLGRDFTGESGRSMGGHTYGLRKPTLMSFGASFPRVETRDKKAIEAYIEEVLNIQPHVIDPYPEAREDVPPMYCTLTSGLPGTKRAENGFYWDVNLEWMEAK